MIRFDTTNFSAATLKNDYSNYMTKKVFHSNKFTSNTKNFRGFLGADKPFNFSANV
jgi:hypothetical protein